VRVVAVETRGFRNLDHSRVELDEGITVFHGPNGAGKTNLLEAIYFGLAGRSFRTGNDRDMIEFDQGAARVELELSGGGGRTLLASLDRRGDRRHLLDGRAPGAPGAERPLVGVFHPDRMELVKGPAARRRAHLDRLVGALWPARADLRARFGRTLAQRNALVHRVRAEQASADSLVTWDERLADEAVPLIEARAEGVEALRDGVQSLGSALGLEGMEVRYKPRAEPNRNVIAAELGSRRVGALGRAYTSYGPQLDELELRAAERPLRRFGSQGQQRTALLALLFAERAALIAADRPAPLMLLDDVMSELDQERRELLVATLAQSGQALLTATSAAQVPAAQGGHGVAVHQGAATAALREAAARPSHAGVVGPTGAAAREAA
jgi:DNA replication and repair protein RecF